MRPRPTRFTKFLRLILSTRFWQLIGVLAFAVIFSIVVVAASLYLYRATS